MPARHKVFVSYFDAEDRVYKTAFEKLFQNVIVSRSVVVGEIEPNSNVEYVHQKIRDEYLRDSTVTVVLIGSHTWQRKFVDWEIHSSLRDTEYNPRSGLLGIILPTYPRKSLDTFNPFTVPPRLYDNLANRADGKPPYASVYNWTNDPTVIESLIDSAYRRKDLVVPINSRPMFGKNNTGSSWQS